APPFTSKFPAQFTDENVTAWRPNGTLAWRFRSQQFCVGARSTFIFAAFLARSRPTSQRQSSRRALRAAKQVLEFRSASFSTHTNTSVVISSLHDYDRGKAEVVRAAVELDLRLASRSGLIDHPANAVLVYAEHRLDNGHRGHHHEVAGAVDAVKLGHFCLVWIKVSMAAMLPSSVALALRSPWGAARANRFWCRNRVRPPQCGGTVNHVSYDKSEDVGPSLPRRAGLFRTAASRMTPVRRKRR